MGVTTCLISHPKKHYCSDSVLKAYNDAKDAAAAFDDCENIVGQRLSAGLRYLEPRFVPPRLFYFLDVVCQ